MEYFGVVIIKGQKIDGNLQLRAIGIEDMYCCKWFGIRYQTRHTYRLRLTLKLLHVIALKVPEKKKGVGGCVLLD